MPRRICVVITARPSYSRIKTALQALKGRCELQIVTAASALVTRFGKVADVIRADGFEVSAEAYSVLDEDTLGNSARSTGLLTMELAGVFERLKPDVVVTIADRHETLATAIAASYQNIPLAHVQGGEVTGSIDDKVRNAVTQLADLHLVATEHAANQVRHMKPGALVYVTGCPSIDLAAEAQAVGPWDRKRRIVVLQHSVTNEAERAAEQMAVTLEAVGPDAMYFWPGEDAGGSAMAKVLRLAGIQAHRNMQPLAFLRMLKGAQCIVGNSSVAIRECSYLGVPAVNIGTRQAGRERAANVIDVGHNVADIRFAVEEQRKRGPCGMSTLYGDGHAGERIAALLTGKAAEAVA